MTDTTKSVTKNENLTYVPDTNGGAILGKLKGICADFVNPTRNGRKYSEGLWKKVFNNDIVKEYFNAGGIFGELGHPEDRSETDMTKIAVVMPEPPKENNKGQLEATFDILDTPNGRILKTLVDYGYKLGISSRGTGDVIPDIDGGESVDEDSYDFQAFDVVLLPAVKAARLSPVTEGMITKPAGTFRQALNEQLGKATASEKKVMEETLAQLKLNEGIENVTIETSNDVINVSDEDKDKATLPSQDYDYEENTEVIPSSEEDVNIDKDDTDLAADNGNEEVIESLQKTVTRNLELVKQVAQLKAQLSVGNAKEAKLMEDLSRYKDALARVSDIAEQSKGLSKQNEELQQDVARFKGRAQSLIKRNHDLQNSLEEQLATIENLKRKVRLTESSIEEQQDTLKDRVESLQKENTELSENYAKKLKQAKDLVEHYKTAAKVASDGYIKAQALAHGLTVSDVSSRLTESYTLKDVDSICEDLQSYHVNVGKLPFALDKNTKVVMENAKKETIDGTLSNTDDEVDESLLRLANL